MTIYNKAFLKKNNNYDIMNVSRKLAYNKKDTFDAVIKCNP